MVAMDTADATPVEISDDVIRLGQFLKLAGLADSGAEARELVAEGEVSVNGEVDTRRGRQLHRGVRGRGGPGAGGRVADRLRR